MTIKKLAEKVFHTMYDNDPFSKWLGIQCLKMNPGSCLLKMRVRREMLNGFAIAHGGIAYSFADSALAFASNSHGIKSVSIETSISHTKSLKEADVIFAEAKEISCSEKIAIYNVTVTANDDTIIALFKGTVYRTGKEWFPKNELKK